MKTLKQLTSFGLLALLGLSAAAQEVSNSGIERTSTEAIFSAGSEGDVDTPQVPKLKPGVYVVGTEDTKLLGTHYLFVESDINDPSQVFALYIGKESVNAKESGAGAIYKGRPVFERGSLMLVPQYINNFGTLVDDAKNNHDSAVIEITVANNTHVRYPYVLQGHNGALNGIQAGMRRLDPDSAPPSLQIGLAHNFFHEGYCDDDHSKASINGNVITLNQPGESQREFRVVRVNGGHGKIGGLVSSKLDTEEEATHSNPVKQGLAFFISDKFGKEALVLAWPQARIGEFKFNVYTPEHRDLLDLLFKGLL